MKLFNAVALTTAFAAFVSVTTPAQAQLNTNLIVNPGAEAAAGGNGNFAANLPGWSVTGELTAIAYSLGCPQGYPCTSPTNPGPAAPGLNHFAGGNVAASTATQVVDLSFASSLIAAGGASFNLSGWLGGYAGQGDNVTLAVSFLNGSNTVLGSTTLGPVTAADRGNATALLFRSTSGLLPVDTAKANLLLTTARVGGGTSNDGYADNLAFSVSAVPEPGTALMLGAGAALMLLARRRLG